MPKIFKIDAVLGSTYLTVKEISNLEKGSVIDLGIPAGESIKCYHNDKFLFNGEIMVFEKNLAVRVSPFSKEVESKPIISNISKNNRNIHKIENTNVEEPYDLNNEKYFSYLSKINPQQLSDFIMLEHPQTIALILSHMKPEVAAETLNIFPDDLRTESVIRMAKFGEISLSSIQRVNSILENKLIKLSNDKIEIGGVKAVGEILNHMEEKVSNSTLSQVEQLDQELAISIKEILNKTN